jgi:hypothetical protein
VIITARKIDQAELGDHQIILDQINKQTINNRTSNISLVYHFASHSHVLLILFHTAHGRTKERSRERKNHALARGEVSGWGGLLIAEVHQLFFGSPIDSLDLGGSSVLH